MKTLEQFIKDNEGQFLEVDGSSNAKFQCVDCVNGYIRDVLGLPIIEWTNAIDFKNKANGNYDIIYNDLNNPSLVPDVGDIVVYRHPNKIGHIGVCIKKGTSSQFGIFEQNWPVGSPCKSVLNKKYIIGDYVVDYWMKPKKSIINDMTDEQKRILDFIGTRTEGDVREAFGALADQPNKDEQIRILNERISFYETKIKELESTIEVLNGRIEGYSKTIDDWQSEFRTANEQVTSLTEQLGIKSADVSKYRKLYENYNNLTGWGLIIIGIKKLFVK